MTTKIKYTQCKVSKYPTFNTIKYDNLLQGSVDQSSNGKWSGWVLNWSKEIADEFRLGFGSRSAAARWVNQRLRVRGVK